MRWRKIESQFGPFIYHVNSDKKLRTDFLKLVSRESRKLFTIRYHDPDFMPELAAALGAYFAGNIKIDFRMITLPAGPPFYSACWKSCRKIGWGKTLSYRDLATMAGRPDAFRAAGQAMRNNPLPVIVPCHRVSAATGKLHGFSGSSEVDSEPLKLKQALLDHEQHTLKSMVKRG